LYFIITNFHTELKPQVKVSHGMNFPAFTQNQGSATYGPLAGSGPPSEIIQPATPLQILVTLGYGPPNVLHFMNLPSLQLLALHTYEELILRNRTML